MRSEATIEINGVTLTDAEAMAVRVACTSYHAEMSSNPDVLGDDEHGRRMTALYRERLGEVLQIILAGRRALDGRTEPGEPQT